jgi:short-subunit dehydrogenase
VQLRCSHVVVTGASRGLGASIARAAALRGARVTLVARTGARLQALADDLGGRPVIADLSDLEQARDLVPRIEAEIGPIDVLVNNAAVSLTGPFLDQQVDDLQKVFLTNVVAPVTLCSQVVPRMIQRQRGVVMTVSSIAGETALAHETAYCASKGSLTQFVVGLRKELRGTPVRIGVAILGEVKTDMLVEARQDPLVAAVADRLSVLGSLDPDDVAVRITDAIEHDRTTVIMPRALAPMYYLRQLPDLVTDQLIRSLAVAAPPPVRCQRAVAETVGRGEDT